MQLLAARGERARPLGQVRHAQLLALRRRPARAARGRGRRRARAAAVRPAGGRGPPRAAGRAPATRPRPPRAARRRPRGPRRPRPRASSAAARPDRVVQPLGQLRRPPRRPRAPASACAGQRQRSRRAPPIAWIDCAIRPGALADVERLVERRRRRRRGRRGRAARSRARTAPGTRSPTSRPARPARARAGTARSASSQSPSRQRSSPRSAYGKAQLADQALALGERRRSPRWTPRTRVPVGAVGGELRERRRAARPAAGSVADLLGERERLARRRARRPRSRPRRPRGGGRAPSSARIVSPSSEPRASSTDALEVLARLRGVADAAEHAAEDAVRAAGGARLAEPLGQPQRLLGGVDREHVVARVHVQRGGLLVQAHELEAGRAVLQQVDALLVVLDRLPCARPCATAPAPILRCRSATRSRSSWPRWYSRHSSHTLDRLVDAASRSATSPCFSPIRATRLARLVGQRSPRAAGSGRTPRGSSTASAAASPAASRKCSALRADRLELVGVEPASRAERRGAAVVLGEQRHDLVGAVAGALLDEARRPRSASAQRTAFGSIP